MRGFILLTALIIVPLSCKNRGYGGESRALAADNTADDSSVISTTVLGRQVQSINALNHFTKDLAKNPELGGGLTVSGDGTKNLEIIFRANPKTKATDASWQGKPQTLHLKLALVQPVEAGALSGTVRAELLPDTEIFGKVVGKVLSDCKAHNVSNADCVRLTVVGELPHAFYVHVGIETTFHANGEEDDDDRYFADFSYVESFRDFSSKNSRWHMRWFFDEEDGGVMAANASL